MFALCVLWFLPVLTCLGARVHAMRDDDTAAALTSDARRTGEEASKRRIEKEPITQCILNSDIVLACPPGEGVGIVTAFFSRRKLKGCAPEERPEEGAGRDCHANATGHVHDLCREQGGETCTVPAGFGALEHIGCPENPYTLLRVRWYCSKELASPEQTEAVVEQQGSQADGMAGENLGGSQADGMTGENLAGPQADGVTGQDAIAEDSKKDEDIEQWKEEPDKRVVPSSMKQNHCNFISVGAYGGCKLAQKSGGHTSSPTLDGDNVCRCTFLVGSGNKKTCDDVFSYRTRVFKAVHTKGVTAIFGWEGCDCYHKEGPWYTCDLSVREVLN